MNSFERSVAELTLAGAAFEIGPDPESGQLTYTAAPRTLRDLLELRPASDKILWHEWTWWSVGSLRARAAALAQCLIDEHEVRRGDRVAVLGHNSPEWVISFLATVSIGAVAVPLNATWTAPEIKYALEHSGARVALAEARLVRRLPADVAAVAFEDLPRAHIHGADFPARRPTGADTATILYTSGSSGPPKGVVSSHRAICQALWAFGLRAALESPSHDAAVPRTLLPVPLFHVTGCVGVLLAALRGPGQVVMMGRWDPEVALELVERLSVTHVVAVPTQWWDLLSSSGWQVRDLSSLRRLGGGGAPAAEGLVRRIAGDLGHGGVGIGYGMTETNGYGPVNSGADYLSRPGSCGRIVPPARVVVRGVDGHDLPAGAEGELWFRGPHLADGYWRDPEATSATWVDGWVRTGDQGSVDDEGFVHVTDRIKEIVVRGGENVSVSEVESVLFEHPAIREVAVLGVPDERFGEVVAAVLVADASDAEAVPATADLEHWLRERLAGYKVPSVVHWRTGALPRTASGKIARAALREELLGG